MSELILYVAGMGCRGCVREVTARLRDVPGVDTVTADHRQSVVRLGGSMSLADVAAALAGITFRVASTGADRKATGTGQQSSRRSRQQPPSGGPTREKGTS